VAFLQELVVEQAETMERFFHIQEQQRRLFNDFCECSLGWHVNSLHGTALLAEGDTRSQLLYMTAPHTGSSRHAPPSSPLSSGSGPVVTGDKDPCTEPVYAEYMVIMCLKY
jgi:hypothetical protein